MNTILILERPNVRFGVLESYFKSMGSYVDGKIDDTYNVFLYETNLTKDLMHQVHKDLGLDKMARNYMIVSK